MSTSCIPIFIKIHQAVLEKKSKMWKVYARRTDDGRTDGRCAMTIAHSSLWLRWANKPFNSRTPRKITLVWAAIGSLRKLTIHSPGSGCVVVMIRGAGVSLGWTTLRTRLCVKCLPRQVPEHFVKIILPLSQGSLYKRHIDIPDLGCWKRLKNMRDFWMNMFSISG